MIGAWWKSILLGGVVAALAAASPVATKVGDLAGRYNTHFRNGNVDGDKYWSDDVVEIVPVDRRHAYFRVELAFFNGHSCSIKGVAALEGRELVYRGTKQSYTNGCTFRLRRDGRFLDLDDGEGSCQMTCGARGGYGGDHEMPWSSRRPITYMARLKRSPEYREAIAEWRSRGDPSRR